MATVGITRHAKEEIGEIVAVQLPNVGDLVKSGDEVCVLESTKAAADLYSPLSGKIVAINEKLEEKIELLNESPESLGWLFQIAEYDPKEIEKLLALADYQDYINS